MFDSGQALVARVSGRRFNHWRGSVSFPLVMLSTPDDLNGAIWKHMIDTFTHR